MTPYKPKGILSQEHRKRISESIKKKYQDRAYRQRQKSSVQDYWTKDSSKEKHKMLCNTESRRKNVSSGMKTWYSRNQFVRELRRDSIIRTNKNVLCKHIVPNRFETKCKRILDEYFPGMFQYSGDLSLYINKRSPDYICKEKKLVVLCHGIYWHLTVPGVRDTPQNRAILERRDKEPFVRAGYKVLVIWEDEIKPKNVITLLKKLINYGEEV